MVSMTQIEHAGNILKSHAAMYQYFTYQNCSELFETEDEWDSFVESCQGDFSKISVKESSLREFLKFSKIILKESS